MTEKKYKGAVFFDIDGTLVDERAGISKPSELTKKGVEALKKNGYLTGIATGRAKCYVPDMDIDFDCYITCNGAVAEINGKVIFNAHIEEDKLCRVLNYIQENKFGYDIETRDRCYYGEKTKENLFEMLKKFSINQTCFTPFKDASGLLANKVMVTFDNDTQFEKLCKDFCDDFLITRHHDNNSCDISIFGITKATGINAVIQREGIDIADTYAFGDDANDIDMLATVGYGIAMTPHSPLLDEVVKEVTASVADDGVYNALVKLGII